jgi:hypothetical protein
MRRSIAYAIKATARGLYSTTKHGSLHRPVQMKFVSRPATFIAQCITAVGFLTNSVHCDQKESLELIEKLGLTSYTYSSQQSKDDKEQQFQAFLLKAEDLRIEQSIQWTECYHELKRLTDENEQRYQQYLVEVDQLKSQKGQLKSLATNQEIDNLIAQKRLERGVYLIHIDDLLAKNNVERQKRSRCKVDIDDLIALKRKEREQYLA